MISISVPLYDLAVVHDFSHADDAVFLHQMLHSSKPMTPPVVSRSSLVEGTLLGIP